MVELIERVARIVREHAVKRAYLFLEENRLELVVELLEPNLFELAGLWDELRQAFPDREVYVWTASQRSPIGGVLVHDRELAEASPRIGGQGS